MPEMDGYEASRYIRAGKAGESNRLIPIIAMTANAMKGDKEKCLNAGMSDYLSKPIEPDNLYAMMEKWLITPPELEVLATHATQSTTSPELSTQFPQEPVMIDSSTIEIWDRPSALRRLGGKEKLLDKLLVLFLSEASQRVIELQQAVEAKDTENTRILAHTIKGSAANISALQLQDIASKLEQAANNADISAFKLLYSELNEAFNSLKTHLSQYQSQIGDR